MFPLSAASVASATATSAAAAAAAAAAVVVVISGWLRRRRRRRTIRGAVAVAGDHVVRHTRYQASHHQTHRDY